MYQILPPKFYARDTLLVAEELIGQFLIHELPSGEPLVAKVVETEAYKEDDPACHAYPNFLRKRSGKPIAGRSALLFGPPGVAYVYLNYGIHWLLNAVTEKEGTAGAVLIRAIEPVSGIHQMRKLRPGIKADRDLANGPGKLTLAMGVTKDFNGTSLTSGPLYFAKNTAKTKTSAKLVVDTSPRIGISKAQELVWRFFEKGNPFVSNFTKVE